MYKGHQTPLQIYRKIPTINRNINGKTFCYNFTPVTTCDTWFMRTQFVNLETMRAIFNNLKLCQLKSGRERTKLDFANCWKENSTAWMLPSSDAKEIQEKLFSFWIKNITWFLAPGEGHFPAKLSCELRRQVKSSVEFTRAGFSFSFIACSTVGLRNNEGRSETLEHCVNKERKQNDTSLKKFTGGCELSFSKTHTTGLNRSTWGLD